MNIDNASSEKSLRFSQRIKVGKLEVAFREFVSNTLKTENPEVDLSEYEYLQFDQLGKPESRIYAAFTIYALNKTTGVKMIATVEFKKTFNENVSVWGPTEWTKFSYFAAGMGGY